MSESSIKYGDHPLQEIKLFRFSEKNSKNLVLLHGGGWRDPNNSYNDFVELVEKINTPGLNLIGINYRLSPEIKHPYHLIDVVAALSTLSRKLNVTKLLMVGHSVGATLMLQLLDYEHIVSEGLKVLGETPMKLNFPDIELETLVFVDGIFDIVELLEEYPDYTFFVKDAFISEKHYSNASQMSLQSAIGPSGLETTRIVVVHSQEDELLSLRQTLSFQKFLASLHIPFRFYSGPYGAHEEVYWRQELADIIGDSI